MSRKHQFRARVKNINYELLEDYMIINDYGNIGEALDAMIAEHKELSTKTWSLQYVTNTVASHVNHVISEELKKILLGINNTDRNTQILIELLQGYMQAENIKGIFTTDMHTPDFFEHTKQVVHERITKQKQRKDSKIKWKSHQKN